MEVKINVDETRFKDILEKELGAFSKEELHSIIREAIIEGMRADHVVRDLCTVKERYGYGSTPSQLMYEAAKTIDLSPAYREIQEKMINELKENYQTLLQKVLLELMVAGITDSYNFRNSVEIAVRSILSHMNNQNS